jgi:hypothetical protein
MGIEFGLASVKLSLLPQFQTVKKTTWFILFLLFAVSCLDDPDCFLLNNDVIGISFRVLGSNLPDSVKVESVTVNNILYTSDEPVITFLPLLADRFSQSTHVELASAGVTRIVDLGYNVKVQFVSEDCGARYILSDLVTTNHNYDSINIINPTPGRDGSSKNIEIYRCPHADTLGVALLQLTMPKTGRASSRPVAADFNSISFEGSELFYANGREATLRLPVNTSSTTLNYTFDFKNDFGYDVTIRNLGIGYKVIQEQRYSPCGIQQFVDSLSLLTVADNPFDSVSFVVDRNENPKITLTDPIETNINIYRCPPANMMQVALISEGTTTLKGKKLISIAADYTSELFYQDTTMSRVILPLNPNATSTVFTVKYEAITETIALNYSWTDPRITLFKPGYACSGRKVITNLSVTIDDNDNLEVIEPMVLYPPVTNINLEVAN